MIIYFETRAKARQIAAKSSNLKSLDKKDPERTRRQWPVQVVKK